MQKFEWDENKDRINQKKHDLSFESAAWVFYDKNRLVFPDKEHSWTEERWITIGMAKSVLFVVYTLRHGDTICINRQEKRRQLRRGCIMLVTTYIDFSKPMPDHVAKELENLKNAPITFDEDCPPLTEEQMRGYFRELLEKKGYVKKEALSE